VVKAGEHGPDKVYDKFTVVKSKHVEREEGEDPEAWFPIEKELTNKGEFIFVLRPETNDKAAIAALKEYAYICGPVYPELSQQILDKVEEIEQKYPEGNPNLR
jgi:hypothetical protein